MIWSLWFVQRAGTYPCRAAVLATLTIAILAIVVGCALAIVLPFSPRPIHTADLELHLDGFVRRGMFEGMSSFPSDHAVLFAALCTGNILMNRTAGALIGLYCFLVVLLPRIIFGLHWPSDILVGICVGAFLALATFGPLTRLMSQERVPGLISRCEFLFYPALFLLTFRISTMFDSGRSLLKATIEAVLL